MDKKKFLEIVNKNKEIVKTWDEWKQKIVINSETIKIGKFIQEK